MMLAALSAALALGTAPSGCQCGLPDYSLNSAETLCQENMGDTTCVPPATLCPNANRNPDPRTACIGSTSFTASVGPAAGGRATGSLGFMYPGEPLWTSLPDAKLVSVPDFMEGLPMWVSEHSLAELTTVRLACPSNSKVPGCRFYVFVYDCQTNCKQDSDLPALSSVLIPMGYHVSHCAPSFKVAAGGQIHSTKSLVRFVPRGEVDEFLLPKEVRFMATSIDRFAHDCASFDQVECIVPGIVDCKVDPNTNQCVNALCAAPPVFQGALSPSSCGTCPTAEIFLPR